MSNLVTTAADISAAASARPTRQGRGGRRYMGPKAQTTVDEAFWERTFAEAVSRDEPHTAVWREVIYAGMLATRRAKPAEVEAACVAAGIDPSAVRAHIVMGEA